MNDLVEALVTPSTFVLILLTFGVAPQLVLRTLISTYPRGHARRRELLAEFAAVKKVERPLWVAEVTVGVLFDVVPIRVAALAQRMLDYDKKALPLKFSLVECGGGFAHSFSGAPRTSCQFHIPQDFTPPGPAWQTILILMYCGFGARPPKSWRGDGAGASRSNVTYASGAAGRFEQAILVYEATLANCERVLGPDHPDTVIWRNNVINAYEAAGRFEQAIPLYETTLAAHERDTLVWRNNLAYAYEAAGQLEQAIRPYEAAVVDCERLFDADHPTAQIVRQNLHHALGGEP